MISKLTYKIYEDSAQFQTVDYRTLKLAKYRQATHRQLNYCMKAGLFNDIDIITKQKSDEQPAAILIPT